MQNLRAEFGSDDLGNANKSLAINIDTRVDELYMHQSRTIAVLLKKSNMFNCKDKSTVMEENATFDPDATLLDDRMKFQETISSLLWIANPTRLSIDAVVNRLARHMNKQSIKHRNANTVLQYQMNSKTRFNYLQSANIDAVGPSDSH